MVAQKVALSRFASSKTRAGDLPPSSRVTRFMLLFVAAAEMALPVAVEPVKEILAMSMWADITEPAVRPPTMRLKAPGGKPAALMRCPKAKLPSGDFSLGLMTTVLPVARAGADFHDRKWRDPFHAIMPPQTPSGFCSTIL